MNITPAMYNSSKGKVVIPGTYTNYANGASVSGSLSATGADLELVTFSIGATDLTFTWLASSDWNELTSKPHVRFVPTAPVSAGTRLMATIYIDWADTTSSNGSGEVALFAKYSDDTYVKVANQGNYRTSGWQIKRQGYRTYLENTEPWIAEKNVVEFMLAFRNANALRGMSIKNWRFFESVIARPEGSVSFLSSTVSSAAYSAAISGGLSTTGNRAGLVAVYGWPHAAESSRVKEISGQIFQGEIVFENLNASCCAGPLLVYDGYFNKNYLSQDSLAFTLPDVEVEKFVRCDTDGFNRIGITFTLNSTCIQCPSGGALTPHRYIVEESKDGGAYTVTATGGPLDPVGVGGVLASYPYDENQMTGAFDPTSALLVKLTAYLKRDYPDLLFSTGESPVSGVVYFPAVTEEQGPEDEGYPKIISTVARGWGNRIFVYAKARDASNLRYIKFYAGATEAALEDYECVDTVEVSGKRSEASTLFPVESDECGVYAIAVDSLGNTSTIPDEPIFVQRENASFRAVPDLYYIPDIVATVIDDTVEVTWTSFELFVPRTGGVPNKIAELIIYKKSPGTEYEDFLTLPYDASGFKDTDTEKAGTYQYKVVALDYLMHKTVLYITAEIGDGATLGMIPFIERYAEMLPDWTAAIQKPVSAED